jgi:hypothetical protein
MVILPAGKVFSLALRMFTKPLVTLAKTHFKKQTEHPQGIHRGIIGVGQFQHRVNGHISYMFLGKEAEFRPLSDDRAFDAGAEFAAETLVYAVLLAWGIYEIAKAQADSRTKDEALKTLVHTIEMRIKQEETKHEEMRVQLVHISELERILN